MSVIKINKNDAYKIKIEGIGEAEESFMKDVYSNAFKSISEIQVNNRNLKKEKDNNKDSIEEEFNNVIAFLGERGSGKTSAMKSVVGMLKNTKNLDEINRSFLKDGKCKLNGEFLALETIDPSKLEQNESILKIVLARMFKAFKDKKKDNNQSKTKILQQFEEVYQNIQILTGEHKSKYDNGLEALDNLGEGCDLVKSFKILVEEYLDAMSDISRVDQCLVISIDDVDMNIKSSYEIMEEIRKYLQVPNVIVMISMKIEQITNSIEEKFLNEYKSIYRNNNQKLINEPSIMATRYLEKLIPLPRRLNLPKLSVKDIGDSLNLKVNEDMFKQEGIWKYEGTLSEVIFEMIFKKTGIVLLKPRNGIHEFIPQNLREVHNFIAFLMGLQDGIDEEVMNNNSFKDDIIFSNLEQLEEYLLDDWVVKNINSEEQIKLIKRVSDSNIERLNKDIILGVKKYLKFDENDISELKLKSLISRSNRDYDEDIEDEDGDIKDSLSGYEKIYSEDCKNENITFGDFIDIIDIYQEKIEKKLLCSIELLYMIKILKCIFSGADHTLDDNKENKKTYHNKLKIISEVYGGAPFGYITFNSVPGKFNGAKVQPIFNNRASFYLRDYANVPINWGEEDNQVISLIRSVNIVSKYLINYDNDYEWMKIIKENNDIFNECGNEKGKTDKIIRNIIKSIQEIHCIIIPKFINYKKEIDRTKRTSMINGKPWGNQKSKAYLNVLSVFTKKLMGNQVAKNILEKKIGSISKYNEEKLVNSFEKLDTLYNPVIELKDIYLIFSIDFMRDIRRNLIENRSEDAYKYHKDFKMIDTMFNKSIFKLKEKNEKENKYITKYNLGFNESHEDNVHGGGNKQGEGKYKRKIYDIEKIESIYEKEETITQIIDEYRKFISENIFNKKSEHNKEVEEFLKIINDLDKNGIYEDDNSIFTYEENQDKINNIQNKLSELKEKILKNNKSNISSKSKYTRTKVKNNFEETFNTINNDEEKREEYQEFIEIYNKAISWNKNAGTSEKKIRVERERKAMWDKMDKTRSGLGIK